MNDFSLTSVRDNFAGAAKEWLCDFYNLELRYVAKKTGSGVEIINALIVFYPWMNSGQSPMHFDFHVDTNEVVVGQRVLSSITLLEAIGRLDDALRGHIELQSGDMSLFAPTGKHHYFRGVAPNPWSNIIQLSVTGKGSEAFVPTLNP